MSLKDRLPKAGSLGARAASAGSWNMLVTLSTYALRLGSNLVMTRLLVPEAFGMIALAGTVLAALSLFTDIGIGRSITREADGDTAQFLRVAWVVKIMRGGLVAVFVLGIAVLLWLFGAQLFAADTVYAQPEMPGLLAIIALSPIMLGAVSTNWDLTVRRLELRRFTFITIAAQVGSILSMIVFASISPTVWALMCGMMVNGLLQCVMSHTMLPGPRMRFVWDSEIATRLWHFGKWLIGSSMLTFVERNADKLLLGAFLGASSFGIYVIAQIWIEAGKTLISRLSDGVGFPVVAEVLRDRPQDIVPIYQKYQTVVDGVCITAFMCCFFLGTPLVQFLYTSEYLAAGSYIELMSFIFLILRFNSMSGLVLNLGHSRAYMTIMATRAVAIVVGVPLGYYVAGTEGAIIASALAPAISVPYILRLTASTIGPAQTRFSVIWLCVTLTFSMLILYLR